MLSFTLLNADREQPVCGMETNVDCKTFQSLEYCSRTAYT